MDINGFDLYNQLVTIGGTFDLFHPGHRYYLDIAVSLGKNLLIYITSDEAAQKSKNHHIDIFEKRVQNVKNYLIQKGLNEVDLETSIQTWHDHRDKYGCREFMIRKITNKEDIENDFLKDNRIANRIYIAAVVEEYCNYFHDINKKRVELGIRRFHILVVQKAFKINQNGQQVELSATAIRRGEHFDPSLIKA